MINLFDAQLRFADELDNDNERLSYMTSILRSILQAAVVVTFEIAKSKIPIEETSFPELTERFQKPSDGTPLQVFDDLIPVIRSHYSKNFLLGWFERHKQLSEPLSKKLMAWVEFRNKRPGHGVVDKPTEEYWVKKTKEIITDCLNVFSNILPKVSVEQQFEPLKHHDNHRVSTPLISNNQPIVILGVTVRQGIWKLKAQILSKLNAEEFTTNLPEDNIFNSSSVKSLGPYELKEIISHHSSSSIFHNVPIRQTDTFEGRKGELTLLKEWMDDQDSRFCLVYGDGGYGKTTLVLEMLNQLLESQLDFEQPLPTIISYHTAKTTRWTENGLIHLTGVTPLMDECVRDLARLFIPVLDKTWYSASGRSLIDKIVTILSKDKFTRNDVLLVIDNTETLATTPSEVQELGAFFKMLGKLVGRVIITSRRREFIEATPVLVEGLSDEEGISLMKRLAVEFDAKPITQAGESKLSKVSKQLMHKPILLEALVKFISRSKKGIDDAIESLYTKTSEDLLEFLYEDAWARLNDQQKKVFYVLINLTSPLNQTTVSKACAEIGIQHTAFQFALSETHFSVLTDYGRMYTLEFVDLAKRFFEQQFSKLDKSDKEKIKVLASSIDQYDAERQRIDKEYQADRIAEAFRSEYARAAKVYADNGDVKNAVEMYELAIEDDPVNSALHDRFSWFLLNKANDHLYAKKMSIKAVELDTNNCDANVGLALACYRLNQLDEGDQYIDRAKKLGRTASFCLLRKAIARYHYAKSFSVPETKIEYLTLALALLEQAEKYNRGTGGYDAKNNQDIQKYKELTLRSLNFSRRLIGK